MANLRIDDQRRVAPGRAPGSFEAPRNDAGAIAGRQMQQMGQQVERAAGAAGQIFTQELERTNEIRVNDAINRAQRAAMEQQREFQQLRGEAALRVGESEQPLPDVVVPRFERSITEIADELSLTPVQRQRYMQQASALATRFQGAALDHFVAQQDAYEESVYEGGVATSQSLILANPYDNEVVAEQIDRIDQLTRNRASRQGLPSEAVELAVRENVGQAFLDTVKANADEDPRGAQDLLDRYRDRMTPAQQAEARNATAGGLAVQDAAAWVENIFSGSAPANPGQPGSAYQMPLPGVALPGPGDRDYGPRPSFRTSNGRMASSNHDGVDFSAPAGTAVRAVAGGRVVRAGPNGGYGNFVEIDHGNGVVVGYAHLQDFDVQVGDTVAPGQSFARVGSTGNSTGPHLHLRARRNGQSMDPAELFSEEARTTPSPGGQRPTRAEAERMARERFGSNPIQLAAARAEITRAYSAAEAGERERYEQADEAAFRWIEQNRSMPPASVLNSLKPGRLGTVQNYLEALTAPPTVRTDPDLELALVSRPDLWQNLTPEEFIARYGSRLSTADRVSYVGALVRANEEQRRAAADVRAVPADAFSRAWTSVLDVRGIDRTPEGRTADAERQNLAQLQQSMRGWIIEQQVVKGRQLTEEEIRGEVEGRIARLAWDRPRSILGGGGGTSFATSFQTMRPEDRRRHQEYLRARGRRDFTEADVYQSYLNERVMGR